MTEDAEPAATAETATAAAPGPAAVQRSSRDPEDLRRRLESWLSGRPGVEGPVEIGPLQGTNATGMSSDTLLFDATFASDSDDGPEHGASTERLVARVAPDLHDVPVFPRYDLTAQFRVIEHVGRTTDVPVPRVRWDEPDPAVLGAPFFVMDRVDGDVPPDVMPYNFGDNWLYDASPEDQRRLQDATVSVIARLHDIDAADPALDVLEVETPGVPSGATHFERHVAQNEAWYRFATESGMRSDAVERAFAWLEDHMPSADTTVLSWGDARIGNVMYRDFEPVAVLDWEMACRGPRELDVSWTIYAHVVFEDIASTFGLPGMPNLLRAPDVLTTYESLTGYEPKDLDAYLTLAAIKYGIVFLRTGARQAHFGEITLPDDHDELLHNRPGLDRMLAAGTWGLV